MFEFFFKYPAAIFSKGQFVLLGGWPRWILLLLIILAVAGLGWLIFRRLKDAAAGMKGWHAAVIWGLESLLAILLLLLVWQPAIVIAELKPQQNIIAVLVDDSRSMSIAESGATREQQAVSALQGGVLDELQKKFQTRLYRLDAHLTRVSALDAFKNPAATPASATRIGNSLQDFTAETAGLPIGAVVLLSDGADNSGGIDLSTIAALRGRQIPVHTVGFGPEDVPNDVEINDAVIAPRAMQNSRLSATVSYHQRGFSGRKATLTARDGDKILASRQITLGSDGAIVTETLPFNAGAPGVKSLRFSIDVLPGETNPENNAVTRELDVTSDKRKILYVEGEPRWEYKFIRRAEDDDANVQLVSMLRTTENKIYRQGITDKDELADGFPATADALFQYEAIIIGSVEAGYFTPAEQELMREFVDRRGGGLLFLGGRSSLQDGLWSGSSLVDLMPVSLPNAKNTFHREPATPILTQAGTDSLITRLDDDAQKNADRWKKLPYLMDYQDAGTPKAGAAVLLQMRAGGRSLPLLVTEHYGRGRTAVMATGGSWRWQMSMPLGDNSYVSFWQQLLRWMIQDTPGQVVASVPNPMLYDDGHIQISADVRDKAYTPAPDAQVQAHVIGPNGFSAMVDMQPAPSAPGTFQADFNADQPGSYVTEVVAQRAGQELGRDTVNFQRLDGVAENFHTEQNRQLLEDLASQTGGKYWTPGDLGKLPAEIPYSAAGITMRETKELWDMPIIFLFVILLRFSEWFLRRKWGVV